MNSSRELVIRPAPMVPRPLKSYAREREVSVRDLWSILVRRRAIVLGTLAVFASAAVVYCVLSPRLYKATGEVQVQKEAADALGLENMTGSADGEGDALDANITLQTQAQVLQSDSLALQVIKDLNLEQNQDFRPKFNPIGWAFGLVSSPGVADPNSASLEDAPNRRTRLLKIFAAHLTVKPVSGTRLIDVSYLNSDPKVAADVVNHLVKSLVDHNFQTRHNATQEAAGWLGNQLADLRKQSEDLQAKVVQLQRDSGVFTLGQTDMQGREQVYTPALDRLEQATAQMTQAQSARIMKGALYQVVKDGDPELISGLYGGGLLASASPGVSGSLTLIQNFRAQEATAQAQLNELSAKFGPGYPKVTEVRASLESTQKALHQEVARVAERVKNDYTMAQQVENSAKTVFLEGKRQANALNDKAVEYEIVRQEAMQSRGLYESLLRRLKEADLVAGLRSSNITLVDPARAPSRPAKPNVLLYIAASIAAGLFLGMCSAVFRDAMDTKIQDLPVLEAQFGETPLGILPYHQGLPRSRASSSFAAIFEPRAPYTEAMRVLRTSLLRCSGGPPPRVILITSSVPGEGKSMLSANLAILMAQQGKKVLLVDGDLRTPVLHRRFHLKTNMGLSSILGASTTPEDVYANTSSAAVAIHGMPGLHVLVAGPIPRYPAEMLASEQMAHVMRIWRREYDTIIVDGAPVLPVTDSVLLSAYADLTLVVARHNMTEQQSLERTCSILESQGAQNVRLVLNGIKRSASAYHDYYGYDNSSYYGERNA
jgi:succinoglycan biosynthesis transport protein ExoP